jgi:serine/threonine protein kinase
MATLPTRGSAGPPVLAPDASTLRPGQAPATPVPGRPSIPGYEILGELGRGGMGVVYKARDLRLKRVVAIKTVLPRAAAPHRLVRFLSEAEAVAQFQHPNIVPIYEAGQLEGADGPYPFFVMEYVDGGTLVDRILKKPFKPKEAARVVEVLARAVEAMHQRGVIHRDLKPSNVLINGTGTYKIADFGIARRLDRPSEQTNTGEVLGTPAYMAPEQLYARHDEIGPATDVYALGGILHCLLTGGPPGVPGPSREKVPLELEAIRARCLQPLPGQRYASAAELADVLRRFRKSLSDATSPMTRSTPPRRGRAFLPLRKRAVVMLGIAALALGLLSAGTAFTVWILAGPANAGPREEPRPKNDRLLPPPPPRHPPGHPPPFPPPLGPPGARGPMPGGPPLPPPR